MCLRGTAIEPSLQTVVCRGDNMRLLRLHVQKAGAGTGTGATLHSKIAMIAPLPFPCFAMEAIM
jgi:hypothetical protein